MNICYDWYKIFCTVADCKSITLAAEKLFISQPAVSQSIRQLENSIGCPLFIRTAKGVKLTAEGEMLYSYISQGVKLFDTGEHKLKSMLRMDMGEIRIGASDMTLEFCLLKHLEQFHREYPDVTVKITNNPTPQTLELLRNDIIDFAVVSEPICVQDDYEVIPVRDIEDIFICGKSCTMDDVYISELPNNQLILLEKDTSTRNYIDSELEKRNYKAFPKFELATSSLLVRFAAKDLGISCVVSDFAFDAIKKGEVRKMNIKDPLESRNICIVKKSSDHSLAASKMISMILNDK